MFKRVWQVVKTIFFCLKNHFFCWNLGKFRIFYFFPDFVGWSRRKLYEKNDLQYFLFQIKIANALYEISYNSGYNALLHVIQIFFQTSNI